MLLLGQSAARCETHSTGKPIQNEYFLPVCQIASIVTLMIAGKPIWAQVQSAELQRLTCGPCVPGGREAPKRKGAPAELSMTSHLQVQNQHPSETVWTLKLET